MRPVPYLTVMGAVICKQTYENILPCVPRATPQTGAEFGSETAYEIFVCCS